MNLFDTFPRPVRNANDLIGGAIQDTVCKVAGEIQGFLTTDRGRGPSAALICLYRSSACGANCDGPLPKRPFTGGQCGEAYDFRAYEYVPPSQAPPDGAVTRDLNLRLNGPTKVETTAVSVGDGGYTRHTIVDGAGVSRFTLNEWWDGGQVFYENLGRVDGGLDNCGDPPPVVPIPDDGTGGIPPTVVYPPGWPGPVYVEGEDENGDSIFLPVFVGPVDINVDDLFPINIDVNGQSYTISPDFNINPRFEGGDFDDSDILASIDGLNSKVDDIDVDLSALTDGVQAILDDLFAERTTSITRGTCGEEPETVEVSGNSFAFMAAALTQLSLARYTQVNSLCPSEGEEVEDVAPSTIESGTAGINHVEFVAVPEDAQVVVLVCSGTPTGMRIYRNAGDQVHAQFGFIAECFDVEGVPCPKEQEYVYTREHVLVLEPFAGTQRFVRLALTEGVSWALNDTGVRY